MSGVAAATLVVGAVGAMQANKNAKSGQEAMDRQAQLGQQGLDYQKQMGQWAMNYADPSLKRLNEAALSSQPLDYGLVSSQIKRQYADEARKLSGLGYGQPGTASALRGLQLGQASDLSQAFAEGLAKRRGLQQFMASTMTPQAMGQAGRVGGAIEGLGNVYGQQANVYNTAAQQGWQGAAQSIQGGLGYIAAKPTRPVIEPQEPIQSNNLTRASRDIATTPPSWYEPKS